MDSLVCPYPNHPGYVAMRDTLSPEEQKMMADTIHITADQKVEIVPLHKKFSLLEAEHNGVDIFAGDYKDTNGNQGILGLTYLTGEAAERICKEQGKKLFDTREEAEDFITYFSGENGQEKIKSFVILMGLEQVSGYLITDKNVWQEVGSSACVALSRYDDTSLYAAYRYDDTAGTDSYYYECALLVVISEDC